MQASLTSVYVAFIRHRVLLNKKAPLGSFLGPLEVSNVSYLWSLELWGALTASWSKTWEKGLLFFTTFVIFVVGVLVGPSGAVLMIPRRIHLTTGNYLALLDNSTILYPTKVDFEVPYQSTYVIGLSSMAVADLLQQLSLGFLNACGV